MAVTSVGSGIYVFSADNDVCADDVVIKRGVLITTTATATAFTVRINGTAGQVIHSQTAATATTYAPDSLDFTSAPMSSHLKQVAITGLPAGAFFLLWTH